MKNSGLYNEFQDNPHPDKIAEEDWTFNHPLHWKTVIFLENFSYVPYECILQECEHIDDQFSNGAKELASKQHGMWIAELLSNSWSEAISTEMGA